MKVINIHKRDLNAPKSEVSKLLQTLASGEDKIWPSEKWPAIRFREGLVTGAKGGHGPIRYLIVNFEPGSYIEFQFSAPKGFHGVHRFDCTALSSTITEFKHTIDMRTSGIGIITWAFAVRWLHDALFEDLMDKVENQFSKKQKRTSWTIWVKLLRWILRPKKAKTNE